MQDGIGLLDLFRRVELGDDLIGNGVDIHKLIELGRNLVAANGDESLAIAIDFDADAVRNFEFTVDFPVAAGAEDPDSFLTGRDFSVTRAALHQPPGPL